MVDHFKVDSDRLIYMATLSKAYGTIGGYIVANGLVTEVLRMCSAAYGFTATLPPDQAMVISTAIDIVADEPERRRATVGQPALFRQAHGGAEYGSCRPRRRSFRSGSARTKAQQLAAAIRAEGIHVDAISFPAVPLKSGRLRIQMNAGHRREDIDHLVDVLRTHQHVAEPDRRFVAA